MACGSAVLCLESLRGPGATRPAAAAARRGPGARPRAVRLRAMGNPRMGAIYAGPRSRLDSVSSRSAARAPRGHPGPRSRGRLQTARDAHDMAHDRNMKLPNLHRRTGGTRIEIISNSIRRVCDTRAPHERGNAPRTTRARRRRVFLQRRAVTSTGADRIERNKSTRRYTYIDLFGWHGY